MPTNRPGVQFESRLGKQRFQHLHPKLAAGDEGGIPDSSTEYTLCKEDH